VGKLKLAKIPDRQTTKMSFQATTELKIELERYTQRYNSDYRVNETAEALIPHILQAFMRSDREFRKQKHSAKVSDQ